MANNGLFVGMVTLDLVYLSPKLPGQNEKIAASDYTVAAGGPATNAAVTFSYLGDRATILGVVGTHPITPLIRSDLQDQGVTIADLDPTATNPPPISSIIVTQETGDRAVVSINAAKIQAGVEQVPPDIDQDITIVMIDGHQMEVSRAIAQSAKSRQIPVVLDGGSWKPGLENLLPFVNYAVCSANFIPQIVILTKTRSLIFAPLEFPTLQLPMGKNQLSISPVEHRVNYQYLVLMRLIHWELVMFFMGHSVTLSLSIPLLMP